MALSWNEIKTRAAEFVITWKDKAPIAREEADAQTFENEFFSIFGVTRSQVAIFEHKVKMSEANGYVDLFWKGHIMIEMKTPGKDMEKAFVQAKNYANALKPSELPKGILICDFNKFHYYNLLEDAKLYQFNLSDLVENIELFSDLAGYKDIEYKKQDAVNIEAAEKMGKLHDRLKEIGYEGHQLEVYLVRLLFCLFADDTGIFEHDHFVKYIIQRTNPDGSDLALHIQKIFEILNKPKENRLKTIDEQLNLFPYVNGGLFKEQIETADFDSKMRETLIECCSLDWSKISPAIFGAMFQSVMNYDERHDLGAHYTSEENILKVIHPLFLDSLWEEFDKYKQYVSDAKTARLNELHHKISQLTFLDPACGCGNFLVIAYRELRILELAIMEELLGDIKVLDIDHYIKVNVDQFYGIEIEEFPCQIAQVAIWLVDHQMNTLVRDRFGQYFTRIPLVASATIINKNALQLDWNSISEKKVNYILGNPPFLGARVMKSEQKLDHEIVFNGLKNSNNLDYVTSWYKKAADYIHDTDIEVSFVSTNSICQGEQVPILWPYLLNQQKIVINFAHQTFKWSNEARGKAGVYCVIIGFSVRERSTKKLYIYRDVKGAPQEIIAKRINAYLLDAPFLFIDKVSKPICNVPENVWGSMPNDGGNLLLSKDEYEFLIKKYPMAKDLCKRFMGADEYLYNTEKYCLWLKDVSPSKYNTINEIIERIQNVRDLREKSSREATRKLSKYPMLFGEIRHPDTDYILIPLHSSENRSYIPIGFMDKNTISSNANSLIPNATLYEFGVLSSRMHMSWVKYVCGRLESRYRYSGTIVYNNFPWPEMNEKNKINIMNAAKDVIDARKKFPELNLAELYDSDTMIPELSKAHEKLDKAVDRAYGCNFTLDPDRVSYLFSLYLKITETLLNVSVKKKRA